MCGIAGILTAKHYKPVTEQELSALIEPIQHRGPDGFGTWLHEHNHLGFAHRRLSIIDLSENGKQPFHRPDLGLTITFNGEIYNYIELKEQLSKKGYSFRTSTDTEVILAAYKEYGYECLSYFDGMFAFAIWDENRQELFCARDRFGEKPFYYYHDQQQFVFASEIKQLWSYGIKKNISREKVSRFMNSAEVMDDAHLEKTFYDDVFSLKASHYLICKPDLTTETKNYWNLAAIKKNVAISFSEATNRFTELFNSSVARRLRSDVPLGSSLSGGLDSSCIVHTIHQRFLKPGQKQYTFSARFNNYEKDEGEYIDALLEQMPDITRADVFLSADEFDQDIDAIIYHQDEPFQSASIFAQYKVMQIAKKHGITVMLDGQGADELLGGYEGLYVDYLKQLFYNDPALYKKEVKAYNDMHALKYGEIDLYRNDTLNAKVKRTVKGLLNMKQPVPSNYFSDVLKQYISGTQLQQLLRYADRNAMAHSVETRLPYLSHELVEFACSLPDHYKMENGWPKYLLRKAFDKQIPDKITWRKNKVGFETPENKFLQTEKAAMKIRLSKEYLKDYGIEDGAGSTNPWLLYIINSYLN